METNNGLVQVFENAQFGNVRVVMKEDGPWFVAADVCRALEIGNNRMATDRLDEDEKMTVSLTDSHFGQRGGAQMITLVNEPGLYTLVLGSRKPEAKTFKRWITHEVIPAIRKTGAYFAPNAPLDSYMISDPIERARRWIEEEETRKRLAATNRALVAENLIWEDGKVINALVRRYAVGACGGDFGKAWRSFYKEILYKHSIGIERRKSAWCDQNPGKKPPAGYRFLQEDEINKGVSCIVSMCHEAGIDVGDILENFEQKTLVAC